MAEVFATGIQMGESPRWHDGRFWMCDWLAGEVLVFEQDGSRSVVGRLDGLPFSNVQRVTVDPANENALFVTTFGGSVWRGPASE